MIKRLIHGLAIATAMTVCSFSVANAEQLDFDKLWNYDNPEGTRAKFEGQLELMDRQGDLAYILELKTQIARTYSLEGKFKQAHKVLDEVEPVLGIDLARPQVRYFLERGRTYNSAGDPETARGFFEQAFSIANGAGEDFFAVDAAHMIAITHKAYDQNLEWNRRGLALAVASEDPLARGWAGSLYNNIGWSYFDHGQYEQALDSFERSRTSFTSQEKSEGARIAYWSMGKTLRMMERYTEALKIQEKIFAELYDAGRDDGYVYEELAELYLALGERRTAADNFYKAHRILRKDDNIRRNEPKRLSRMLVLIDRISNGG